MINCIIVDDEPLARQLIASYINELPELHLAGSYESAADAFTTLHNQLIDVMFLDIEMPGINGINFVKSLKRHPKIIFISAHTTFAVDAFEIDATDYLVKPVTFDRFLKAVDKIIKPTGIKPIEEFPKETASIFLKVDRRLVKVDFSVVLYIEGMGDYLKVHLMEKTYVTYLTMAKIESLLPPSKFARIHRSTIINIDRIQYIEGNVVVVNGVALTIGLTYRETFLKRIN
ncbi:LytR/AlgR family response regulator transcription factor [Pedobacter sp. KLB.chiD]|uniref:LytR/AlgR family response regulator transcription factor n=1 Tax=Pedobacter sp. KLB.chiD TaxID=3387402 RepID=UPI00399BD263